MLAFETTVSEKIDRLEGQYSTLEQQLQSITQPEIQIEEPVVVDDQIMVDKVVLDIFRKYDNDESGTIDRDEAKAIILDQMKKIGMTKPKVTEEQLDQWFNEADINGDG
jgi:Ca2+-binding EF-hand superfamily protein